MDNHAESLSYAASGYGRRMGWGDRPALLLIDVCKAYWTPGSPLDLSANPEAVGVPVSLERLVKAARAGGVPVVWTAVEYSHPDMADAGLFWRKAKTLSVWQVGSELHQQGLADWVSETLTPQAGDTVVKKKYASGFFGTTLATELSVLGVDTVVIGGVSTSGCVRASTLDAMQSGFRPMVSFPYVFLVFSFYSSLCPSFFFPFPCLLCFFVFFSNNQVVPSACGDRSKAIQDANLFDLDSKYADVVEEDEAVAHLQAGWAK